VATVNDVNKATGFKDKAKTKAIRCKVKHFGLLKLRPRPDISEWSDNL